MKKVVLLNGLHWCISWRWGCSSHWGHRWGGGRSVASASWDGRPLKRRSRHDHVSDQGFDGSFANQSDKKELLNHLRWHCPQWGESQKKPAKSCRLIGILGATIFFECTLRLFLHLLYDLDVGQPWCICNGNGNWECAKLKGASYFGQITRRCIRMKHIPEVKSTMAFMHEYSALSTWRALSFSTCSWKIRMWSMKDTTRSAAIGAPWSPAATKRGATLRGILHCAALSTNNSDQTSLSRATWSVTCNSGNPGIFLVHSTALKYQNYIKRLLIITKKGQKSITNLPKQ